MKIRTEIEIDQIVDIRCALNSLQFILDRIEKLDKDNFAVVVYQGDRENLNKAREAIKALHNNVI